MIPHRVPKNNELWTDDAHWVLQGSATFGRIGLISLLGLYWLHLLTDIIRFLAGIFMSPTSPGVPEECHLADNTCLELQYGEQVRETQSYRYRLCRISAPGSSSVKKAVHQEAG